LRAAANVSGGEGTAQASGWLGGRRQAADKHAHAWLHRNEERRQAAMEGKQNRSQKETRKKKKTNSAAGQAACSLQAGRLTSRSSLVMRRTASGSSTWHWLTTKT
jgi:hypothetical protein